MTRRTSGAAGAGPPGQPADGTTNLTGQVVDQAQLHGVLARIRDLGVPLLTLRTLDHAGTAAETEHPRDPGRREGR